MTLIGYTMMCEQAGPKQLVHDVALAEEAGFDSAVISDHYFPWLLDERDENGRVSIMDRQRWAPTVCIQVPTFADQRRDPQRPEQPDAQRRPGRRSRSRASHAAVQLPLGRGPRARSGASRWGRSDS